MKTLEQIDKNLAIDPNTDVSDLKFYDVREEPFRVFGLYDYKNEPEFCRLPESVAKTVSEGVRRLAKATSGGRVRFATTSRSVAIAASMNTISRLPHMPLSGSSGFDIFVEDPDTRLYRQARAFIPPYNMTNGYVSRFDFADEKLRYITINFPLYNSVKDLKIGLMPDAELREGLGYKNEKPIVYYGSSITQGGCASRPGNAYQSIVSRRLEMDFINLGFSGNGRGEDTIVDYMRGLDMCAFVCDYDHNAGYEQLIATHKKMYERIREVHPDIPYIIMSKVDVDHALGSATYSSAMARREVIFDTYRFARAQGDKNVYFIDGESVFRGYEDLATVETVHPNDIGFALMANAVTEVLKRAFTQGMIS